MSEEDKFKIIDLDNYELGQEFSEKMVDLMIKKRGDRQGKLSVEDLKTMWAEVYGEAIMSFSANFLKDDESLGGDFHRTFAREILLSSFPLVMQYVDSVVYDTDETKLH
jgi:hypothetical protein